MITRYKFVTWMGHVICYKINAIIINWDMNRTTKDNEKPLFQKHGTWMGHQMLSYVIFFMSYQVKNGDMKGHEMLTNL